ncbi:uncharacterized protein LOC135948579 [Cloeon dipterum]|uniref:uncharacterized protein LOC135948579 n=1 Tax=Cloeon dipterum TaxID=197152 RepID=UPI0032206F4C
MTALTESFILQSKINEFETKLTEHMNNVKLRMQAFADSLLSNRLGHTFSSGSSSMILDEMSSVQDSQSTLQSICESFVFSVQIIMVHLSNLNVWSVLGFLMMFIMIACLLSNGFPDCSDPSSSFWCLIITETKVDPFE